MLAGLAAACLAYPALSASGRWGNWIAIALVGMLTFGPDTLMGGAATQDLAVSTAAATAAGYVNSVGSLGQMVSPLVVSVMTVGGVWDSLFYLLVVVAALGALALATRWGDGKPVPRVAAAGIAS